MHFLPKRWSAAGLLRWFWSAFSVHNKVSNSFARTGSKAGLVGQKHCGGLIFRCGSRPKRQGRAAPLTMLGLTADPKATNGNQQQHRAGVAAFQNKNCEQRSIKKAALGNGGCFLLDREDKRWTPSKLVLGLLGEATYLRGAGGAFQK